jgi:hypothetical protein
MNHVLFSSLQRFLLRDGDFEESSSRGPALAFILKKNPHSSRWGEMKLFLLCQVIAYLRQGLREEGTYLQYYPIY